MPRSRIASRVDRLPHPLQVAGALALAVGDELPDLLVDGGLQVLQAEVLQLVLDAGNPQPAGQGRVDVEGLHGDALAVILGEVAEGAHVVQFVGQLDEDDAHVLHHGEEHLADGLRVLQRARAAAQDRDLRHPLHEGLHLPAELLAQRGLRGLGVLQHVVQQRGNDRLRVHVDVHQDRGDAQRVDEEGVPRGALLLTVQAPRPLGCRANLFLLLGCIHPELLVEVRQEARSKTNRRKGRM